MGTAIRVGVSSCLLGEKVRYDGGHKHDRYIAETLGRFFTFVPVCPEVGCGLAIPREAMHLEGNPDKPRLVTIRTHTDLTGQMLDYCRKKVEEIGQDDLCGFIFKKGSPSSGLHQVKVYTRGAPARSGRGLFAAAVVERFPLLPVEEEGRLCDPAIRENFIERVFACRRWKDLLGGRRGLGELVRFHTAQKLQVMAHSPQHYREMGKLVADGKGLEEAALFARYEGLFMAALALQATHRKNTNVLLHIMGYFKKQLATGEKEELLAVIDRYHRQFVPLVVPLTLLGHYVNKYDQHYLKGQTYLNPHPMELMLGNHV